MTSQVTWYNCRATWRRRCEGFLASYRVLLPKPLDRCYVATPLRLQSLWCKLIIVPSTNRLYSTYIAVVYAVSSLHGDVLIVFACVALLFVYYHDYWQIVTAAVYHATFSIDRDWCWHHADHDRRITPLNFRTNRSNIHITRQKQEAQLSLRYRATLNVIEYFASHSRSLEMIPLSRARVSPY